MLVKVQAFAGLREILGKERELEMREAATVAELLAILASANAAFKEAAFDDSGSLRDYVLLMVNRKRIDPRQDLSRELHEGDELALFPPVAGG
ncbi:MAG: MoaD/ThiS family protein [Methanothrix sp.]|jgi:molybdopterin synthase sulfur carrier subunit|nr:MoaD/ThiS family protein [Methanothrix sp.]